MPTTSIPSHDFQATVMLYEGVPFDSDHTLCYFPRAPEEPSIEDVDAMLYRYETSSSHEPYSALSFIRKGNRSVRLQASYNNNMGANYMRIYNGTGWGDHPYYAFVTDVVYVNETTIEVYFVIDTIMTYISTGIVSLHNCWIDRQTVWDDTVGANLMPENVDLGDYIFNECKDLTPGLNNYCILMAIFVTGKVSTDPGSTTTDPTTGGGGTTVVTSDVTGGFVEGMYSAATIRAFPMTKDALDHINRQLAAYVDDNQADNVYLYMAPKYVVSTDPNHTIDPNGEQITGSSSMTSTSITIPNLGAGDSEISNRGDNLNGYKPRNAKLFTYPYNFLSVSNNNGGTLNLRYEYFDSTPTFQIDICAQSPVSAVLRPKNYEGTGRTRDPNKSLALSGYPMCPWMTDGYSRWVAGNRGTIASGIISAVGTLVGAGAGFAAKGAQIGVDKASAMAGLADTTKEQVAAGYDVQQALLKQRETSLATKSDLGQSAGGLIGALYDGYRQSDYVNGTTTPGSIQYSSGLMSFYGGRMSIKAEYAKSIDDYFSLYGYKVNSYFGSPQMQNRYNFDYVKTSVCQLIFGDVTSSRANKQPPTASEVAEIKGLFNRGLRFSHNSTGELGSLGDNVPVNPQTGEQVFWNEEKTPTTPTTGDTGSSTGSGGSSSETGGGSESSGGGGGGVR